MTSQVCDSKPQTKEGEQPSKKNKCEIRIIPERCKGCTYCIEFCPKKVLQVSDKINSKGYYVPVASHLEACIACKLCEHICPDFCIFVEKHD